MSSLLKKFTELKKKVITKAKRILFNADGPIFNYYKKSNKKTALVSYITAPFKIGEQGRHNNEKAVQEIVRMLDEFGYNVDIINYIDNSPYNFDKYSAIVGFGDPFCNSYSTNSHAKRLFYSTGMEVSSHNFGAIKRLKEFYKKHHVWLPESARLVQQNWNMQSQAVDGIITYGNKTIQDSFRKYYDGPIFPLHNIHFKYRETVDILAEKKDWTVARKNFFFIIGSGAIHKGLDIVLELFAKHPEWELHLGAPIGKEKRFYNLYQKELSLPNIHFYGFIYMNTPEYLALVSKCGFYLSPTVSEGCPTSVINICSNGKCIPIATKESGLDNGLEIPIEAITEQELEKSILSAQKMSDEKLDEMATKNHLYFASTHSQENYRKELKTALSAILKDAE